MLADAKNAVDTSGKYRALPEDFKYPLSLISKISNVSMLSSDLPKSRRSISA